MFMENINDDVIKRRKFGEEIKQHLKLLHGVTSERGKMVAPDLIRD